MVDFIPLTLVGANLGHRHHYLNSFVNNVHQQNVPLLSVLNQPEKKPIDRIFKIDLASKHRYVDFIIQNLKENDMLYVSRALKCQWLLLPEYSHICNPVYLESHLYPEMTTTAVNKMKNYLELNLKDPIRCCEFYEYYKSNYNTAIKFLRHCSEDIIIKEFPVIMDKLTPKYLRILCEACPRVAQLYFDGLQNSKPALVRYLENQQNYHNSIRNVLKVDGNLYLDLMEKYFDKSTLNSFSPEATKYVMKNFKNRYISKPELYAAWLLHVDALVMFLTSEEIKDIVFRLARANYLSSVLTYKSAEPFIKRLGVEERSLIKKQIFVDKSIGNKIETWPYPPPEGLKLSEPECDPFEDIKHEPYEYEYIMAARNVKCLKRMVKKRKGSTWKCEMLSECMSYKSGLEQLFDRYRFANFDKVFFEFRRLLLIESTIEGRRNMMLVLISKAGCNEIKVKQLLQFLVERHSNEPVNLRDAVARSMVKRAFAWRLPAETWELLLKWATTSVREILHATVLRNLLANSVCSPADLKAYTSDFSDLADYPLNGTEKALVAERLPELLISAKEPTLFLDTIKAYNRRVESVPGAEEMLIAAARDDENILRRIFELRIARRHLLDKTFKIIQTDDSYLNALRHDVSVLANGESFISLLTKEKPRHDRFLRALVLYFSEPDGLAVYHLSLLEKSINENCRESFARPLAFLLNVSNNSLDDYVKKIDAKFVEITRKKFLGALRANAFVARPLIDVDGTDWRAIGAKIVSNKLLVCRNADINKYIQKSLGWKRTMRVALHLATRHNSLHDIFGTVIEARPLVALKFILSNLRKGNVDLHLWNQIKPVILNLDLNKTPLQHVRRILANLDVPSNIESEYWTTVYKVFRKASELDAMPMLCRIENLLTEVDGCTLTEIISDFLRDKLTKDVILNEEFPKLCVCLYFRLIAKYLLTSKSEDEQCTKIERICDPFFDTITSIWKELDEKSKMIECLDDFLFSLKYSKAFLNTKYVSCIPMFETILKRLQEILPREHYFQKYVYIHLTMLYFRSIRQALKQKPEVFENPKLIRDEGLKAVGVILGKYISFEIQDLVHNYFESILDIYQKGILGFFSNYFEYDKSRMKLIISMIRGLIEGQRDSQLLAQQILAQENSYYMEDQERQEILELLKCADNAEMKFFLYEHICPY